MPHQLAAFKAEFFKALAHPIRIRIVDSLRNGEKGVNELSDLLQIEQANVSQQLAILRVRNIVLGRKAGNNVFYSVADPTLFRVLDVAREAFQQSPGGSARYASRKLP
jgi:DNA-binding transcriptional ArsR family regulator